MLKRRQIGWLIRQTRKGLGHTIGDLAREAGVSVVEVSDVELGESRAFDRLVDTVTAALERLASKQSVLIALKEHP
mgnify:CR=1 FL=1